MPAIGMVLGWFGYGLSLWGYCLVKGYDVGLLTLLNPVHPYTGGWPPAGQIPDTTVFPGGTLATGRAKPTGAAALKLAPGAGTTNNPPGAAGAGRHGGA